MFYALGVGLVHDEEGVGGIDEDDIFDAQELHVLGGTEHEVVLDERKRTVVFIKIVPQGFKRTQIRPAQISGNDPEGGGALHDGVVHAAGRDGAAFGFGQKARPGSQSYPISDGTRFPGAGGGGQKFGVKGTEFVQVAVGPEAEHAAVTEETPAVAKGLGRGRIGFFAEGADFGSLGFDVAVASIRPGRYEAKGDEVPGGGQFLRPLHGGLVGRLVGDDMVGGRHQQDSVGGYGQGREGNGGGGVAGGSLNDFGIVGNACLVQIGPGQGVVVAVAYYYGMVTEGLVALQREPEQGFVAE